MKDDSNLPNCSKEHLPNRPDPDFAHINSNYRTQGMVSKRRAFGRESNISYQLYRHYNKEGELLYVGVSLNSMKRLYDHRTGAHWFREIETVKIQHFNSRDEAEKREHAAIISENPKYNILIRPK